MKTGHELGTPYQFALMRYTPNAAAGEFVNVGVALWVPQDRELFFRLDDSVRRISLFFGGFNAESYLIVLRALRARLEAWRKTITCFDAKVFSAVLRENANGFGRGPIGFGIAPYPWRRCDQLFDEFVLRHKVNHRPSPVTVGTDIPWVYRHVIDLLSQTIADPVGCPWWVLRPDEGDGALILSKAGEVRAVTEKNRLEINAVASELWETNPLVRELLLPFLSRNP